MSNYDRLSAQDASFLYTESPVSHMHVTSLAIFEDPGLDEEALNDHFASRLHLVPRFRKRLAWVPAQQGRPVWVDDPHFDIRYHVRYTGLARPGDESAALRLMSRVVSRPLDRARPLWEAWVFHMPGGRLGIIHKTHHCLIDGISAVDLGTVALDLSSTRSAGAPPPAWSPQPLPGSVELLTGAWLERMTRPAEIARSLRALTRPQRAMLGRAAKVGKGLLSLGKAQMERAPTTSLSGAVGAQRRFDVVRMRLEEVRRLKKQFGCSVNDVVLAVVTGGLRRLLLARGDSIDGLVLKAMVPVSVQDPSELMTYGNVVTMLAADLPVGDPDPLGRLMFIRSRMTGLKESNQAVGADFWAQLSEYTPPTLLALAGRAAAMHRAVNLVIANVPGPQFPLYLRGGRLLEAFPSVPLRGTSPLSVAVLSYDGQLGFGLTGDYDIVPDLHVLADGIRASLAELEDVARPGELSVSA